MKKHTIVSFWEHYSNTFTLEGMQQITGIEKFVLNNYFTGCIVPNPKTLKQIEKSLHDFGKELTEVEL